MAPPQRLEAVSWEDLLYTVLYRTVPVLSLEPRIGTLTPYTSNLIKGTLPPLPIANPIAPQAKVAYLYFQSDNKKLSLAWQTDSPLKKLSDFRKKESSSASQV